MFIFVIMLGFPIAFTLMAMGIGFGYYAYFDADRMRHIFDNRIFDLFVNQTYSVMANDVLTAIPLFLFMGYIVERANIVDRLFDTLNITTRRLPGSMAVAALITCALFATATGIVGAVVTLMGLLALPAMLKAALRRAFRHRRHLRRRHARHPHPAVDHADRLCGDVRRLDRAPLCRRADSGLPAGRPLPRLHRRHAPC